MAASTDQNYRDQKALDYVFAVSCVLMLVGTVWMFVQDFFREFKSVQREFRNVEEVLAQRAVLELAPTPEKLAAIEEAERNFVIARTRLEVLKAKNHRDHEALIPVQAKQLNDVQFVKADYDSIISLYDIEVDKRNAAEGKYREQLEQNVKRLKDQIDSLRQKLQDAQAKLDDTNARIQALLERPLTKRDIEEHKHLIDRQARAISADDEVRFNEVLTKMLAGLAGLAQTRAEEQVARTEAALKEQVAEFDRYARLVEQKRWGLGDSFRRLPIIDAFASPIRIEQYTLEELPINYNFKYVTRYDRCTTCHQGIEREAYTKRALTQLGQPPTPELQQQLSNARETLRKRRAISKQPGSGLDPDELQVTALPLTRSQVTQYAAHPRLDLFVAGNSPHPGQSFGCTICHSGQGSSTDFYNASHTPTDAEQTERWREAPSKKNEHGGHSWHSNHYWDFPMLPSRFIESTCVKCHYQMTDLIRDGNRNEAPKLLRGYELVREFGCFGCHEIAGIKQGRWVGPDLRVEPSPPLDAYTPAERVKLTSDPLNPPGSMRKVGPSLRRLTEKTNPEWLVKWLREPRNFRPDTKMPHFYGLSNNVPEALPSEQQFFPDAELHAVAYFLMQESGNYLQGTDKFRLANEARLKDLEQYAKDGTISDPQKLELQEVKRRLELNVKPVPLPLLIKELPPHVGAADRPEQLRRGRQLFSERGCLACHQHDGTEKPLATPGKPTLPAIHGEAQFGPNLSRLAAKLGTKPGDEDSARRWLIQWVTNPTLHHPRTRMPITHLEPAEANDIALWLLSQKVTDWTGPNVPAPDTKTLQDLARVLLSRSFTQSEVKEYVVKGIPSARLKELGKPFDADERELETSAGAAKPIEHKLKMYIGKKAIGQLGCFGCHDIPGFEYAKAIGTPLNDWGKKDPERLAFEDVTAFVHKNYNLFPKLTDDKGKPVASPGGKSRYETYFFDLLEHHQREGFLYQKLLDPRSYDYARLRVWDERLRMPQFRFARTERKPDESDEEFKARADVAEAEAREAVMTFILGLLAEPIPPKYVNQPAPEKLAEVKGRQILEKYNCGGCHLIRSGSYEFKTTPLGTQLLNASYNRVSTTFASDHFFPDHNAWAGLPSPRPDRLTLHGINGRLIELDDDYREFLANNYGVKVPPSVKQLFEAYLTEAVRFTVKKDGKDEALNIPAASTIILAPDDLVYPRPDQLGTPAVGPYGGTFGNVLSHYLTQLDPQRYGKTDQEGKARVAVPPALLRQGEKTQPVWLYQFLRNPHQIRRTTVLRMPKFNMSDDEAMALVNYFSAVDKLTNPAAGLHYPYLSIPERDDGYIQKQTAQYVERLKKDMLYEQRLKEMGPIWEGLSRQQAAEADARLKAAEARVAEAEGKLKAVEAKLKEAMDNELKEEDNAKKKKLEAERKKLEKERDGYRDGLKEAEKARDAVKQDTEKMQAQLQKKDFQALRREWETNEIYLADAYKVLASTNVCRGCHQVGSLLAQGAPEQQGPPLNLTPERLRPDWTLRWLANPQRFMTYPTPMPQNFARNANQWQDMFKGSPMEQVTGVRDALMNYHRVLEMPANRSRPAIPVVQR